MLPLDVRAMHKRALRRHLTGSLSWDYQLSPSGLERPLLVLPMAPSKTRQLARRDLAAATNQLDLLDHVECMQ